MRIRDHRAFDEPDINLVPLIDVILVLIIFFVVPATFDARSVLKLALPRATGEQANDPAKALLELVNAEGRYFVDDREVLRDDVESLKGTMSEVAGNDRDRPVLRGAAAATPYRAVGIVDVAPGQSFFRRIMTATAPQPGDAGPEPRE